MLWVLRRIVAVLCLLVAGGAPAAVLELNQAQAAIGTPAGPTGEWQPVALPHNWETTFPGHTGDVWYRLRFEAPLDAGLLGVYVQRACTNLEVSLNGELVGSGGLMSAPVARNCYYPHLLPLPRALLRPGTNELVVRVTGFAAREVSARQRAAGLSALQIGPREELQPAYDRQLFWNITVAQIIAATIGALGVSMLGLAALRRKDTYLFYFGLFSIGWSLLSARLFVQNVPLGHLQTEILICSAFPPILACAYLFLMRYLERRRPWVDALLWLQALVVPVVLALAGREHLLRAASTVYNLTAVEFAACVIWFFVVAWRRRRREFWLMGGVLAVALVLVALEIALQNDLLPLPKIHLIHFAMPFVFAVIGVRLIQLFVQALHQAETANVVLEQRVAEKSRELERNYEQLTTLRAAQAAQTERQRIASDLHDDLGAKLLTIAQASLHVDDRERVAGMARQALDEMRLSVRGLTGEPSLAADVLADWRAETVTRLVAAGIEAHWEAGEPPDGLVLPARTHVQLTRVLREAISNTIRHSRARHCAVRIALVGAALRMEVEDDGAGLPPGVAQAGRGHGLLSIERRIRQLRGEYTLGGGAAGGTRLSLTVPLAQSANIDRT
ncbi:sensor histidine kinase [Caenimonas sedimenti]|nr:ATP-binding protein [Caenimonas sedimenti]